MRRLRGRRGDGGRAPATTSAAWDRQARSMKQAISTTYAPIDEADFADRGANGDANTLGAAQLVAIGDLGADSRVLEIGCGIARVGRELAPLVGQWHGVDISASLLEFARVRTAHLTNVVLSHTDGTGLAAIGDGDVDFVYSTATFSYIDPEEMLAYVREAHRVLVDGGSLYFDLWNVVHPDSFRLWRDAVPTEGHIDAKSPMRLRCTSAAMATAILEDVGFDIVSVDAGRLIRILSRKSDCRPLVTSDDLAPFGYVDRPRNAHEYEGESELVVVGWALDDVSNIEVEIDGTLVAEGACNRENLGVAAAFPRYPDAASSGFRIVVPGARLSPGRHEIAVTAIDGDGRRGVLTGFHCCFVWR